MTRYHRVRETSWTGSTPAASTIFPLSTQGVFPSHLMRLRQLSTGHAEYVTADVHAATTSFCIREAYTISCPIT